MWRGVSFKNHHQTANFISSERSWNFISEVKRLRSGIMTLEAEHRQKLSKAYACEQDEKDAISHFRSMFDIPTKQQLKRTKLRDHDSTSGKYLCSHNAGQLFEENVRSNSEFHSITSRILSKSNPAVILFFLSLFQRKVGYSRF
jgi:hypothetical protein